MEHKTPATLLQEVLNYLSTSPCGEVMNLSLRLMQLEAIKEVVEANIPAPEDEKVVPIAVD